MVLHSRRLLVLLLVSIVTAANAAPTIDTANDDLASAMLSNSIEGQSLSISLVTQPPPVFHPDVSNLGVAILGLPGIHTNSTSSSSPAKSLPAVPGALLMALAGFLCVSMVRDRRIWLAAILWLAHASMATLPQFGSHPAGRRQPEQCTYPNAISVSLLRVSLNLSSGPIYTKPYALQAAIIPHQCGSLPLVFKCLAPRTAGAVYISREFPFAQLPRGPPQPA